MAKKHQNKESQPSKPATLKGGKVGSSASPRGRVQSALDQLVQQFSQSLACLRELVQNSIDAGSNRVDIQVAWDPKEKMATISVSDAGEGMTRQVIDERLTQLFSSSKENDLTKVGKFGVGFVSVFAMGPKAVLVDTGCRGESWRIIFHPDRSFDRVQLPHQVDGTTVTLFLEHSPNDLEQLVADCKNTALYWCKHCTVDIFVNGEPINQAFALTQPLAYQHQFQATGTRGVLAVKTRSEDPDFSGYYNSGLTLLEEAKTPIKGLTFKLDSRYLEHTLTRDAVQTGDDYQKALAHIQKVLDQDYWPNFRIHFEGLVRDAQASSQNMDRCYGVLALAWKNWPSARAQLGNIACFPCFGTEGGPVWKTASSLLGAVAEKPLVRSSSSTHLVQKLVEHDIAQVLQVRAESGWSRAVAEILGEIPEARDSYILCQTPGAQFEAGQRQFQQIAQSLKGILDKAKVTQLQLVEWQEEPRERSDRFLQAYQTVGIPCPRGVKFGPKSSRLVCNVDHPLTQQLLLLAENDLPLAIQWLAQRLSLTVGASADERSSLLHKIVDDSLGWKS